MVVKTDGKDDPEQYGGQHQSGDKLGLYLLWLWKVHLFVWISTLPGKEDDRDSG